MQNKRFINNSNCKIATQREKMKKQILFALALLFPLILITAASAFTITTSDSFTAVHNSILQIPVTVNNAGGESLANVTITATNILTGSILTTTLANRTVSADESKIYTIDYAIPIYTYSKSYLTNISLSAQYLNGTAASAGKNNVIITVNASKGMSTSASTMSPAVTVGTTTQSSLSITNTGNVNLTNIAVTQQSTLNDSDNDIITLAITSDKNLQSLQPGESATIYVNATVPSGMQRRTYSTGLAINSTEGTGALIAYNPTVRISFCELGSKGSDFAVTIKEPDDGDDFYPNNDIPVMVRVKNENSDDRDAVITVNLYDETDNEFLDTEVETDATIDGDSSEDFEFTLQVPLDVSSTHDYRIYAKAYEDGNEEKQCDEEYLSIDIKKETHSIIIDKVEVPTIAKCEESFDFKVKLANAGKDDEDDVKLQIVNSELGINEEKLITIDSGDSRTITMPITIQKNTPEKDYLFVVRAYFQLSNDEYKKDVSSSKTIKVQGNCLQIIENTVINAEVLSSAFAKEQFGIKLTVFNTGSVAATYNIIAENYDSWAQLDRVEPTTITVEAGKSAASYIYLTPLETAAGTHTITLKALYGDKKAEKTVTVSVGEKVTATSAYQKISQRLSNLSGFDLATVNIVLVVAIILVFIWVMRVRKAY